MKRSGQLTVFLSMIILCICALMCGLLESARTAGTRWYFKMAAASSLDSVMSGYHRQLWDRYHLLLLEADGEQVEEALTYYMKQYEKENHLYPLELLDINAGELTRVTDYAGEPLEEEITDYMRFGFLDRNHDFPAILEGLKGLAEADGLKEISGLYEGHSGEAFLMEQALEEIQDSLNRQKALVREGEQDLEHWNGSGFVRTAEKLIKEMERMPRLMETYEKRADALGRSLDETAGQYEKRRDALSSGVTAAMEAEMERYRQYTDEDGQRRQEVLSVSCQTEANIPAVQAAIDHAEEVMDYIDSWEGDDEDDELDEEPLWRSVLGTFRRTAVGTLGVAHGIGDKEKKGFLENIRAMVNFELLEYVLPEEREVSSAVLSSPYLLPSQNAGRAGLQVPDLEKLPVKLAVAEYSDIHFNDFTDNRRASPEYEMEYLLCGEMNDRKNLEEAVRKLVMLREGLNLVHILTDGSKAEEARALAAMIVGATGLAPLIYVTAFFIMCIWALGEAVMDVKVLLAGGKVPLIKDGESWQLSLENLLDMGRSGSLPEMNRRPDGLDYMTYMKLYLMLQPPELTNYRILDLIQVNLGREQKDFRAEKLLYRVRGFMTARGRYLNMRAQLDKAY